MIVYLNTKTLLFLSGKHFETTLYLITVISSKNFKLQKHFKLQTFDNYFLKTVLFNAQWKLLNVITNNIIIHSTYVKNLAKAYLQLIK